MTHNLPLIPIKKEACADVRPLLREVFRGLDSQPVITEQLKLEQNLKDNKPDGNFNKFLQHTSESDDLKLKVHEEELKHVYARRLVQKPKTNNYLLDSTDSETSGFEWEKDFGIIKRKDLLRKKFEDINPPKQQWIANTCKSLPHLDITGDDTQSLDVNDRDSSLSVAALTIQSISIGKPDIPPSETPPLQGTPSSGPQYILCVPTQLDFVNFTVGHNHVKRLRLINTSKCEVRLSLQPPSRLELHVELQGNRGLTVTSGSMLELKVHFKPRDVRAFQDELLVRVSLGSPVSVPISCYMQPPLLDVMVQSAHTTLLSSWSSTVMKHRNDVLDLGARLLGEAHRVPLRLRCSVDHASFYILSEDAWCTFTVDEVAAKTGVLVVGAFSVSPVRWGGALRGQAACRAPAAGLRAAALRVLSSTAVVRPLSILADAILFSPEHVTLQTPEKTYDIFSEGDPSCPHYVHLGTAFPNQPLSATVQLINHSSVTYSYYWSVRAWDDSLTSEEQSVTKDRHLKCDTNSSEALKALRVEPYRGVVAPRSSIPVHACAPLAGETYGTKRAVLMLVLTSIPLESLTPEYEHMVIKTETVVEDAIPGLSDAWSRTVCQVMCTQMEVWWDVVPVQFTLHPPLIELVYSKRVKSIEVPIQATQLYGKSGVRAVWKSPQAVAGHQLTLAPAQSVPVSLNVELPSLCGEARGTEKYKLEAIEGECSASCAITLKSIEQRATLRPPVTWLGVVAPGAALSTELQFYNNTSDTINWRARTFPRLGTNAEHEACNLRLPCAATGDARCACGALRPAAGTLPARHSQRIVYECHASAREGCVVALMELHYSTSHLSEHTHACTVLIAYRVLMPRLLLRVLPPGGGKLHDNEDCKLDERIPSNRIPCSAVLLTSGALTLGHRSRYQVCCTNFTPIATAVTWEMPKGYEETLKIKFTPERCEVGPYATETIQVELQARAVSRRRLWACRACVQHTHTYLYLVIDTAIDGRKITVGMPLDGCVDSVVTIVRTEQEASTRYSNDNMTRTPDEIFNEDDLERKKLRSSNEVMQPVAGELCPCLAPSESMQRERNECLCLQFKNIPVRTVRSHRLALRNEGAQSVRWAATTRRWRQAPRRALCGGQWVYELMEPGVGVQCRPQGGWLPAHANVQIEVSVYADCWGLYKDQLLINLENLEPVILDIWMEVVGAPIQFAIKPDGECNGPPVVWVSTSDPKREVNFTNTSRFDLSIHTYVLEEHEHPQDTLPLRLYLRLYEVPPKFPLGDGYVVSFKDDTPAFQASIEEEPSIGVELFLSKDYGIQRSTVFKVGPETFTLAAGARASQVVHLNTSSFTPTTATLLLRIQPLQRYGPGWHRAEPPPQRAQLRAHGRAQLLLSRRALRVVLSALDLPPDDVTRVRKYFRALNTGDGILTVNALTEYPWSVFVPNESSAKCVKSCKAMKTKTEQLALELPPKSSIELCAEATVRTSDVWPTTYDEYASHTETTTPLKFYDQDRIQLLSLPLIMQIEIPTLRMFPKSFDFGFVTFGDCRKTYFTISHTSTLTALEVEIVNEGDEEFVIWPTSLRLLPRSSGRVYVQYTARRRAAAAECVVCACAARAAGRWCRAHVALRASPTPDCACALPAHDHTDDTHLLPTSIV